MNVSEKSGADILVEALSDLGVEVIFGYPGGAVLPIYDELFGDERIRHILVRHEQGAGHAAEGYAAASGKTGVAIATSGPGATNLVTAIADAYMDSVPLLCITGQVFSHLMGTDAFQEADIVGITMPITKHSFLVKRAEEIPGAIAAAYEIASTGRPGPVLVDIVTDPNALSLPPGITWDMMKGFTKSGARTAFLEGGVGRLFNLAKSNLRHIGGAAAIEQALKASLLEELELKPRKAFGPLRVAITGATVSPPLFESMELLGRERSLARLTAARGGV